MTEQPGYGPDRVLRGLSLRRRIGYVVAGLASLAGAALVAVLWVTEPVALPVRTQLAFSGLIVIGLAWGAAAARALSRRPMFAVDRVIAAALAVFSSTLTMVGAVAVARARASTWGMVVGAGVGLTLIAISTTVLVRSFAYRATLQARKREFEPSAPDTFETSRSRLPIGPLALALRHRRAGSAGRHGAVVACVLGLMLVAGIVLLMR